MKNIEGKIPNTWWERFKFSWGFCTCGGRVNRIYPHKAECNRCHRVFDVDRAL
jgi:hypothetical protein